MDIKERADKAVYEPKDGHPLKACEVVAFASGYERGATEQAPISYLRGRNEALIEMADVIEKKEQATIDKACEAYCILCDYYLTCHDLQDFDCGEIQEFKDKIKELI